MPGYQHQLIFTGGKDCAYQLVPFIQLNGDNAARFGILEAVGLYLLYDAARRRHQQVCVATKLF